MSPWAGTMGEAGHRKAEAGWRGTHDTSNHCISGMFEQGLQLCSLWSLSVIPHIPTQMLKIGQMNHALKVPVSADYKGSLGWPAQLEMSALWIYEIRWEKSHISHCCVSVSHLEESLFKIKGCPRLQGFLIMYRSVQINDSGWLDRNSCRLLCKVEVNFEVILLIQTSAQEFSRSFMAKLKVFSAANGKMSVAISPLSLILFSLRLNSNSCIPPWQHACPTGSCADSTDFLHENYCRSNVKNSGSYLFSTPNNQEQCLPRSKQLIWAFSIKLNPGQIVDKSDTLKRHQAEPQAKCWWK